MTRILLFCLGAAALNAQINHRYTEALFVAGQTHADAVYATAQALNSPYMGESRTHASELKMHVFQPQDDGLEKRPVLVSAHVLCIKKRWKTAARLPAAPILFE